MPYIQVKWLVFASKQMGSGCNQQRSRRVIQMREGSVSFEHILNTHLALFQSPEISEKDSKLSHIAWISGMDIRKCRVHH